MPTISINLHDLESLLGQASVSLDQVEAWLPLVKGEVKDYDTHTGEIRVELQDSNRPDLWSCEGIARQIHTKLQGHGPRYSFFTSARRLPKRLIVSPGVETIRPFVAACSAVGHEVTDESLVQLIQVQEKLADMYGRKRRTVSIGLYRLERIRFPVRYDLVSPDEVRFTPLGFEEPMALGEILAIHPKGLEYGPILAGQDRVPLLRDSNGQVLSLPPIINSREIGEVRVGDRALLVEVTGTDLPMVLLALNILAANLADRGASIEPIEIVYPYKTVFGKSIRSPMDFSKAQSVSVESIQSALGQEFSPKEIRTALRGYGYAVKGTGPRLRVTLPAYRNDLMHVVDIVEDVAISRGYESFGPVMPSEFTVGGLSRVEQVSDRVRDLMIGLGFQEIISNVLSSREDLVERMCLGGSQWDSIVEIDNVMSQSFSCLRQWILPSLLRVERTSSRSFYPHRIFEVGEVGILDLSDDQGSRTHMVLGALLAHASANFSEIQSCLEFLLYHMGLSYSLEPLEHPAFLAGRVGTILAEKRPVGLIGEVHPEVLERWQVTMPTVAFELSVDRLLAG